MIFRPPTKTVFWTITLCLMIVILTRNRKNYVPEHVLPILAYNKITFFLPKVVVISEAIAPYKCPPRLVMTHHTVDMLRRGIRGRTDVIGSISSLIMILPPYVT